MKKEKHTCLRGFPCAYLVATVKDKGLCTYLTDGPNISIDLAVPKNDCELKYVLASRKEVGE